MLPRRVPGALAIPLLVGLQAAVSVAAAQHGPQGVVREFCQRDALGMRTRLPAWWQVAPLVTWRLEPAWDHVVVIAGYAVGPPRPIEGSTALAVDVSYSVVGTISPDGIRDESTVSTVRFRVDTPGNGAGWRILGPPPPPHVFAERIDPEAVRASLADGAPGFVPNSLFVARVLREAGWPVPRVPTPALLLSAWFRSVDRPAPGDLVVYLRDGRPYHVGILAAADAVVSATLNAGVVRTAPGAFPGDIRRVRLVDVLGHESADAPAAGAHLLDRLQRLAIPATPTPTPDATPPPARGRGRRTP